VNLAKIFGPEEGGPKFYCEMTGRGGRQYALEGRSLRPTGNTTKGFCPEGNVAQKGSIEDWKLPNAGRR